MSSIKAASVEQIEIGLKLGINLSTETWNVAAAKILDVVGPATDDVAKHSKPTPKQIALARTLGIDIANDTFRVGWAKISDTLLQRNLEAIQELQLRLGDDVVFTTTREIGGETHVFERVYAVSSIKPNGMVYFKGGGGRCTSASRLRKVNGVLHLTETLGPNLECKAKE